jgi:hypothetical protein
MSLAPQQRADGAVAGTGRVQTRSLDEASGLIASTRESGVFWTHNDGEDGHLYAIRSDGSIVSRTRINARFEDWEDIATDAQGRLYLADVGNNSRSRKQVRIYRLPEPDTKPAGDLEVAQEFRLTFAGKPFNCESLFIWKEHGYLISKSPEGEAATLYRFDLESAAKKQVLQEVLKLPIEVEVTAADISPDGARLAVLSHTSLFVLRIDGEISNAATAQPQRFGIPAVKAEGCSFTEDGVLVIAESGHIFRVRFDQAAE